jgi:hypothetical protein
MPRKRTVSAKQRREVRTGLAKLKKAGVLSPRFNVRSAPVTKKNKDLIEQYRGIVEGKLKTVRLPKSKIANNREDGLRTVRDRVIIENSPGSKVIKVPSDPYGFRVAHEKIGGIRAIEHRGGYTTNGEYFDLAKQEITGKNNLVGFTVNGHKSNLLYNTVEAVQNAFQTSGLQDKISGFTIYEIPRSERFAWKPSKLPQAYYKRYPSKNPARKKAKKATKKKGKK